MRPADYDNELRATAFAYLDGLRAKYGDAVPWRELREFTFEGDRISLVQPQRGIRVVSGLPAALTILTKYSERPEDRPYEDIEGEDGYFRYKWRGTDPEGYDNVALRRAMELGRPLAWFVGVASGVYLPIYPLWLIDEEPSEHQFVMAFDQIMRDGWSPALLGHPEDAAVRKEYALRTVRQRLHQRVFRERVLTAYQRRCALCRLRHPELLDAAHIKEDSDGGPPIVPNGVAMCAIHHRAFDSDVIGIRPDYVLQVRPDVLIEVDGPTLRHALQSLHGEALWVPRKPAARPNQDLLDERYERFLAS